MPDLSIAIATDHDDPSTIFDDIIELPEMARSCKDKVDHINKSPYSKTLFVDADTCFADSIDDLYEILEYYSLSATHTVHRRYDHTMPEAPIPEYNTGGILFRFSEEIKSFINTWQKKYMNINEKENKRQPESSPIADQPSFRYSVFQHSKNDDNFSFLTLPPEYNVLTNSPGFLRGTAKILHGKHEDTILVAISETLNHHTETPGWNKRVYYPAP